MTVKSFEKLDKSRVELVVSVDGEAFEAAVQKAYLKMRGKINVPGFRPGKAPRKMIEKLYGAEVFYNDAIDIVLPDAYTEAVGSSGVDPVGYPEIAIDEIGKDGFTFKATVAVYPEVKLGQYKGLEAEKAETVVTADEVSQRLSEMAERNARLVSVEREVKLGDIAVIDFEGFDNGVPFEGGKGTGHELEIGSGSFVPGFEDQLIGMKAGEEKDIDITFPEDYHADLAGKAVVFHVKVNEVKFKELPAIDDEFAKDVSEFDTLAELEADLKTKMAEERELSVKVAYEEQLMTKVADGIEAEIPDAMIDEQCARFLENFKQRLASQGIPYDQYCKMTGMDEAKFMAEGREPAEKQVRMDLAVSAIIKEEKLEASDEEIEAEYAKMAEKYGMDAETVKKYLTPADMTQQVLNEKVIALVVDNAVAVKPEQKAEEKTDEAAE